MRVLLLLAAISQLAVMPAGAQPAEAASASTAAATAVPPPQHAGSPPGTPANPPGSIAPNVNGTLLSPAPVTTSALVNPATGGDVAAGNIGISIPAAALVGVTGPVSVTVGAEPRGETIPGGPFQYSPNGTIAGIRVTDQSGRALTAFPAPITLILRYNAADVAMARGNSGILTAAYQTGSATPSGPAGSWQLFQAATISQDLTAGTVTVQTPTIGVLLAVFTQPLGYVRVLVDRASEFAGWGQAPVLGYRPRGTDLQVVAPQVGTRLLVLDPLTNNYAYVDANAVGPAAIHYDQVAQAHPQTALVSVSGQ